MVKVLVTGVNGFVGQHVAEMLHGHQGVEISGVGRQARPRPELEGIITEYVAVDPTDPAEVSNINLRSVQAIINLAGLAKSSEAGGQGELYNRVNVNIHTNLYQECINQGVTPRIIAVSSGSVYSPNQPMPITEESELVQDNNTNEYVISKKLTEQAVLGFGHKGLHCIIARPFNHTGPGQLPGFLLPDLYEQVLNSQKTGTLLRVGNLNTKRDFTDVRDVARAYVVLATCDTARLKHSIYNICSGKSMEGAKILKILTDACGISGIKTQTDPSLIRNNDVMDIYGSFERLRSDTGWQPTISIEQTVKDFILYRNGSK